MSEGEWIHARSKKSHKPQVNNNQTNSSVKKKAPVIRKKQPPWNNYESSEKPGAISLTNAKNPTLDKNANANATATATATTTTTTTTTTNTNTNTNTNTTSETPLDLNPPNSHTLANSSNSQNSHTWANHMTSIIESKLINKKYNRYAGSYIDPSQIIPVILPKRRCQLPSLLEPTYNIFYSFYENCWIEEKELPLTELDHRFEAYFKSAYFKNNRRYEDETENWTPTVYDSDDYDEEYDDYYSDGESNNFDFDNH